MLGAHELVELGLYVVQIYPHADGRCLCPDVDCPPGAAGKHPRGGVNRRTRDASTIRRWWREHPHDGLGIATGDGSLIIVVDVDPRHGGRLERTETGWLLFSHDVLLGELPVTRVHRTGGGGWHVFLSYFPGLSNHELVAGVEIKTNGGQVVAPPSVHVSGERYTVLEARAIADAPAWLLAIHRPHRREEENAAHTEDSLRPAEQSEGAEPLANDSQAAARTPGRCAPLKGFSEERIHARLVRGRRNSELTRYAGRRRFEGASDDELRADLHRVNRTAPDPSPAAEVDKVAKSVARYPKGKGRTSKEFARARAHANRLEALTAHVRWPGTRGATKRACFLVMLDLMRDCGTTTPTISTRQLAELVGTSHPTAMGALRALVADGWLRPVAKQGYGSTNASMYAPQRPDRDVLHRFTTSPSEREVALVVKACRVSEDAFRWRALGKNGALVLAALERQSWPSALALSKAARIVSTTADRNLRKLECCGLAVHDENGWHRGPGTLEEAAQLFGTAGRGAAEKSKHADEREVYRHKIAQPKEPRLTVVEGGKSDGATSTRDEGPTTHAGASRPALDGTRERAGVRDVWEQDAHVAAGSRVGVDVRMVLALTAGQGGAR